jgi:hypothetical protein
MAARSDYPVQLEFRLHDLELEDRHCILLPRLNRAQLLIIKSLLEAKGFSVSSDQQLVARRGSMKIHFNSSGYCLSASDLWDVVVPIIPQILAAPKEQIALYSLLARYMRLWPCSGSATVRFLTRVESSRWWRHLRAVGQCGLSPDERALASFVIGRSRGSCALLTDLPGPASRERVFGRRRYYESTVPCPEAAHCLREAGMTSIRNAYLPADGVVRLSAFKVPGSDEFLNLFRSFGDWCSFSPLVRESSNCRP